MTTYVIRKVTQPFAGEFLHESTFYYVADLEQAWRTESWATAMAEKAKGENPNNEEVITLELAIGDQPIMISENTKTLAENAYDNTVELNERVEMLEDKLLLMSKNMESVAKILKHLSTQATITEDKLLELALGVGMEPTDGFDRIH